MARLKPELLQYLVDRTQKEKSTVRKDLSILRRKFPNCTLNAIASIYAKQHGFSVLRMISKEDKDTLPTYETLQPKRIVNSKKVLEKKVQFIKVKTSNIFYNKHILEINRAYIAGCYTATNILLRKIIENMVIDLLRAKFPPTTRENKELYYDTNRKVYNDFSKVLENLFQKRRDFGMEEKKIERLNQLCKNFKDDANDKTHSLFHIVERKEEIDNLHIDTIFALIDEISKSISVAIFV